MTFYALAYDKPISNPFIWHEKAHALEWAGKVKTFKPVALIRIKPKKKDCSIYLIRQANGD